MKKWIVIKAVKFVLFAAAAAIVFGYGITWLWNALIPEIFHLNTINFCQAIGLLILSRILFGGFGHRWGGHRLKGGMWKYKMEQKMASMTPEEREEFQAKWKNHCGCSWDQSFRKEEPIS